MRAAGITALGEPVEIFEVDELAAPERLTQIRKKDNRPRVVAGSTLAAVFAGEQADEDASCTICSL